MIWFRAVLIAIAVAFWAVAYAIRQIQRGAASCDVHSMRAGQAAVAVAWLCVALGVGAIAASVFV